VLHASSAGNTTPQGGYRSFSEGGRRHVQNSTATVDCLTPPPPPLHIIALYSITTSPKLSLLLFSLHTAALNHCTRFGSARFDSARRPRSTSCTLSFSAFIWQHDVIVSPRGGGCCSNSVFIWFVLKKNRLDLIKRQWNFHVAL